MLDRILIGSSVEPTDANFKNVTLLLHGNGSNGAQNNTFIDSSTNNFTITRNGNTTQGSFSPYGSNWSNYFNGGIDRLQVPVTSNMYLGTTYTIEAWAYYASSSYGARPIFSQCEAFQGGFAGLTLTLNTSGQLVAEYRPATSGTVTTITGPTVTPNTWFHIALVSNNSSAKLYVNGIQVGSTTTFGDYPSAKTAFVAVGSWGHGWNDTGIPAAAWIGYISNMRVVKGSAVYTSNFTPSTTPLTAISGTVLLTCQSNRFIDNSSVNNTLTPNGSPKVTNFAPFAPSSAYSTSANGGSGYFDGTGDYLSVASNAAFGFGTGDYTVESWVYPTSVRNGENLIYVTDTTGGLTLFYNQTQVAIGRRATAQDLTATYTMPIGAWTHIAVSRQSGTTRIYINGVEAASTTTSYNYPTGQAGIGDYPTIGNLGVMGFLANTRVVKGTAVYTAAFTPPTSPVTAITNTSLLTNFTNAAIFDNSMKSDLETVGNAQISTSVKKFGTGSMSFVRSPNSYLVAPNTSSQFSFGEGNFTIEAWIYMNTLPGGNGYSSSYWIVGGGLVNSNTGFDIAIGSTNLQIGLSSFASLNIDTAHGMSANIWYHVAVVRSGATLYAFINGSQLATASVSGISADPCLTGISVSAAEPTGATAGNFDGYIDELRITKGVARYTANFTPPTAPFPNK